MRRFFESNIFSKSKIVRQCSVNYWRKQVNLRRAPPAIERKKSQDKHGSTKVFRRNGIVFEEFVRPENSQDELSTRGNGHSRSRFVADGKTESFKANNF